MCVFVCVFAKLQPSEYISKYAVNTGCFQVSTVANSYQGSPTVVSFAALASQFPMSDVTRVSFISRDGLVYLPKKKRKRKKR